MCDDEVLHNLLARVADLEERLGTLETELAVEKANPKIRGLTADLNDEAERLGA